MFILCSVVTSFNTLSFFAEHGVGCFSASFSPVFFHVAVISLRKYTAMIVLLSNFRSRRRSRSIEVPTWWFRRGLADGIGYSGPIGAVGTHETNQISVHKCRRNATPVDRVHREETGNIAFLARTCLVLSSFRDLAVDRLHGDRLACHQSLRFGETYLSFSRVTSSDCLSGC